MKRKKTPIDIHAGNTAKGTMLYTAAHEVTHFIREWSPRKFKVLADFLVEKYGDGETVNTLVKWQQDKAWRNRKEKLSYSKALEEFVADSMEKMLSDGKVGEMFLELRTKDKGLVEKILEGLKNFANRIKQMYKKLDPDSYEGKLVGNMKSEMAEFQKLLADALNDASETYQWIGGETIDITDASKSDIALSSRSYYNEFNTNVMQWAYSASTKVGDVKFFNKGKIYVLFEATEDGCIEITRGKYAEVKERERIYGEENESFDRNVETYKSIKRRNNSDMWNHPNREMFGRNSGNADTKQARPQEDLTTENAELVRSNNQGESNEQELNLSHHKTEGNDVQLSDRYAEYDKSITIEDIRTLRTIGRKSINEFTSDDLAKTQKWAHKFYQQLGEKSPFFRAWFGDWRAYDINEVKFKSNLQLLSLDDHKKAKAYFDKGIKDKTLFRGDVENIDTAFTINVGTKVYNDTLTYADRELSRYKNVNDYQVRLSVLTDIETVVKHSVLFDTEVAFKVIKNQKKTQNMYQSFFHKFYTLVKINGEQYLVKLTVDELNSDSTIRRAYNVNDIKISPVAVSQAYNPADTTSDSGDLFSTISISNLHKIVNTYDKSFNPKPVDKHLVNEDGTPKKFYHGTNETFTEFDPNEFAPREGSFFFAENKEDAKAYGDHVFEVYLTGDNFADYDSQPLEFYQLRDKRKQVEYLRKRGYDGWYADMDSEGWGEVSVFSNTQIKSATDNIGTFDGTEGDIQFSDRDQEVIRQYEKVNAQLKKRNQKLEEDVQSLKELNKLQRKRTNGKQFTKTSLEAVAKRIMKYTNAKGSNKSLKPLFIISKI